MLNLKQYFKDNLVIIFKKLIIDENLHEHIIIFLQVTSVYLSAGMRRRRRKTPHSRSRAFIMAEVRLLAAELSSGFTPEPWPRPPHLSSSGLRSFNPLASGLLDLQPVQNPAGSGSGSG